VVNIIDPDIKRIKTATRRPRPSIDHILKRILHALPPVWTAKRMIADNPLEGYELFPFKQGVALANRLNSNASLSNRDVIKWCQAYFDEGQAKIPMPGKGEGIFKAWRALCGQTVLPEEPKKALAAQLEQLQLPEKQWEEVLLAALLELPGWAGYAKKKGELEGYLALKLALNGSEGNKRLRPAKRLNPFPEIEKKEKSYREHIRAVITPKGKELSQPDAQLVFCLDVRSEPLRRKIEAAGSYETFGMAGFFGVPIAFIDKETGRRKEACPAILKPAYTIDEKKKRNRFLSLAKKIYEDLKTNFATAFALAETLGLGYGLIMGMRTLFPKTFSRLRKAYGTASPEYVHSVPLEEKTACAKAALETIGLTKGFSPLVIFVGHGSTTANNPYASSLNCGACGSHKGGPNAAVLAEFLNDPEVRKRLMKEGISIPKETFFAAGEHDTTRNTLLFYSPRLKELEKKLNSPDPAAEKKSSDWSEVRPEWGLARNAALIIAPRRLTQGADLEGRVFLHSYEREQDPAGEILEKILLGPLLVAYMINSQYLFSTVDPIAYGSGSKITQNITGTYGIMQGNGSDLMDGLPLQSTHSADDAPYHEPVRLQVFIDAPEEAVDAIVRKHPRLDNLVKNEWIHLSIIDGS